MARPFLSVILPLRNEGMGLALALVDVDQYLAAQEFSYEIIAVSDGATDQSGERVKALTPFIQHLKIIQSVNAQGEGRAARTGIMAAKGTWRLVLRPDHIPSVSQFSAFLPSLSGEGRPGLLIGRYWSPRGFLGMRRQKSAG